MILTGAMISSMSKHVCPWWLAYTFDNPLRRIFHKPDKIFIPYLNDGMTAIDIGCGMGYFSIGMARLVGKKGRIISVDIQQEMLTILTKRAKKAGVAERITTFLCDENNIGIKEKADFALAFWMAHETVDEFNFLKQVYSILNKSGKLLLAEPKMHVRFTKFKETVLLAQEVGFDIIESPEIYFSHATLLEKR
ncbi:MAG: methyltransferase domain-containing protein [Nitrospiraceae bacterium]|nr:MAG: methyltransferase domain-containing protein [Nitrospiraceae bacterium]